MIDLARGLRYLMEKQTPALRRLGHYDLNPDTIARYSFALQGEVFETAQELGWKVWKKKSPDLSRVSDEWADVLHFLGTMMAIIDLAGVTPEELAEAFETKWNENQERFDGRRPHYGTPAGGFGVAPDPSEGLITMDEAREMMKSALALDDRRPSTPVTDAGCVIGRVTRDADRYVAWLDGFDSPVGYYPSGEIAEGELILESMRRRHTADQEGVVVDSSTGLSEEKTVTICGRVIGYVQFNANRSPYGWISYVDGLDAPLDYPVATREEARKKVIESNMRRISQRIKP